MHTYEISSTSDHEVLARLSNFTKREFIFRGVPCNSIEGILQALKCSDWDTQKQLCLLSGKEAKKAGEIYLWQDEENLYWEGEIFPRHSRKYQELITEIFDAAYRGDTTFMDDLLEVEDILLAHSIGNPDARQTVLTEVEFLFQIYRLGRYALENFAELSTELMGHSL